MWYIKASRPFATANFWQLYFISSFFRPYWYLTVNGQTPFSWEYIEKKLFKFFVVDGDIVSMIRICNISPQARKSILIKGSNRILTARPGRRTRTLKKGFVNLAKTRLFWGLGLPRPSNFNIKGHVPYFILYLPKIWGAGPCSLFLWPASPTSAWHSLTRNNIAIN